MKILIVDNNIDPKCWGASDLSRFAAQADGATVVVRRGPHDDLPKNLDGYDRIVLSGSMTSALDEAPWISNLDSLIKQALDRKKPMLGVCYGHQRLAAVLGGKQLLRKSPTPEFGWTRIELSASTPLFKGLDEVFYSASSHFDEVKQLPPGTKLLASSEGCEVQAYEVVGAPIFGIQFHPEKSLAEGNDTIASRRKKGEPKVLLNPDSGHKLFDAKVGQTIFGNFFSL